MQFVFIGLALAFGLVAFGALGLSIYSYLRLNGHMELVVKLLHHSSNETQQVGDAIDAVLIQNKESLEHHKRSWEQQRKASNHERVLLASLNRQLVKLEDLFQTGNVSIPSVASAATTAVAQQPARVSAYNHQIHRAAAQEATQKQTVANVPTVAPQVEQRPTVPAMQAQVLQAANELSQRRHKPLDSLMERPSASAPTGARIPLAQQIRLQNQAAPQQQAQQAAPARVEPVKRGPVFSTRETIDVLKMKERRVANG